MAHEGEKKRAKAAAAIEKLYLQITLGLYMLWFVVRVLWRWSSLSIWSIIGLCFLSVVNYLSLQMIIKAAQIGTPYEIWQDVLLVNWFVQSLSMFTSHAWWFWLTIPVYLIYQYGNMARGFLGRGSTEASEAQKRIDKKAAIRAKYL